MKILIAHIPPTADSALFRARHPDSWWWTPDHDFLSSILYTLQGANWQRAGGKGQTPSRIERPKDKKRPARQVRSAEELAKRKQKLKRR